MTLFEVAELTDYWAEHPPVHIALAAFLGVKGRRRAPARAAMPALHQALSELGPGFLAGDVNAGLPPAVLDFAELARGACVAAG